MCVYDSYNDDESRVIVRVDVLVGAIELLVLLLLSIDSTHHTLAQY